MYACRSLIVWSVYKAIFVSNGTRARARTRTHKQKQTNKQTNERTNKQNNLNLIYYLFNIYCYLVYRDGNHEHNNRVVFKHEEANSFCLPLP